MINQRTIKIIGFVALLQLLAVTILSFVERLGGPVAAIQSFGSEWLRLVFGIQIAPVSDPVIAALVGVALLVIFLLAFGLQVAAAAGLLWAWANIRRGAIVRRLLAEVQLLAGRVRWWWKGRGASRRLANDIPEQQGLWGGAHDDYDERATRYGGRALD